MTAVIETSQLHKHFGDVVAVKAADLTVAEGEIFGLVGPDGAGKTTLIRLLVTAMQAQRGSATVGGHDVIRAAASVKREIGYMSQQFSLYRDLSVIENIHFFREIHMVDRQEAEGRIERLLDFARLSQFKDRPAGKLSGGMKQKLGLCCALIHTPRLLFLDEPTTGVDPISRRELWDLLYELWRDGLTIVITTPYMDEASRCTDLAFMQGAEIIARGTPAELTGDFPYQIGQILSSKARQMKDAFQDIEGVNRVHQHGEIVQLMTEDYNSIAEAVQRRAEQIDDSARLRQTEPNLEDVFLHYEGGLK